MTDCTRVYLEPTEGAGFSLTDNGKPAFIKEGDLARKFKEIEIQTLRDAAEHMAQTTIPREAVDALLLWAETSEKQLNADINN